MPCDLDLDNPAWRFALDLYGRPGVAAACLALQDEAGLDVSLLLVCLWLGQERGIPLDPETLRQAEAVCEPWAALAVRPLRAVRRALKASPLLARAEVAALRSEVQAVELGAERIEIALLHEWAEALAPGAEPEPATARRNLDLVLARRPAGDGKAAATLADALAAEPRRDANADAKSKTNTGRNT